MCKEYELIATENLLLHLSPIGKLIILLPARITFAAGRVRDFRRFIQQSYSLDEIAELPVGVLSNTGVKTFYSSFLQKAMKILQSSAMFLRMIIRLIAA